jgi:hypothetical protein
MRDLLNEDTSRTRGKTDNRDGVHTELERSGWGFFSPEISFFLVDFCEQLSPIQRLIFYAYFVNGMTLEEIADRLYSPSHDNKFVSVEECDEDDKKCKEGFHSSHQAVHHQIVKIEKKLRHSWQYMDRWNDKIITKNMKGKKVRVFNPNKKKEK